MKKEFRIVFMGTPEFAVPSLEMLVHEKYPVVAVVTQPDRPVGRGHKLQAPPVKEFAEHAGIPVGQFNRISCREGVDFLKSFAPNLFITAAFGHILSEEVLSIPEFGCVNVHASLLPKLRGAAPIQWAIINGERETGVTTMYTVKALDAGDILEQKEMSIPDDFTAGQLYNRLSLLGADVLRSTLQKMEDGTLKRTPQNERDATYFPMFKKGFGEIDFSKTSKEIYDFVRGTNPVPGSYVMYYGEKIRIWCAQAVAYDGAEQCGTILYADGKRGLAIRSRDGIIRIEELQRRGARRMSAADSLRGNPMECGYIFHMQGENT